MRRISLVRMTCAGVAFWAATVMVARAQVFDNLFQFDYYTDGDPGVQPLVQGPNGNLYGITQAGGPSYANCGSCGTFFEITPAGKFTLLYSFCAIPGCPDGSRPWSLILATDGNFYGTTLNGPPGTSGTFFRVTPEGELRTLYIFCETCVGGDGPYGIVQASNGNFYGVTLQGGTYDEGVVFEITPAGVLTALYNFCSDYPTCADGANPISPLIQGGNGNFYGITNEGSVGGYGTIFEITPAGKLTTLHSFCSQANCADGSTPEGAPLVQASNGSLYGTVAYGGTNGDGVAFEITPSGEFTILHTFCSLADCADGHYPDSGLMQATNGALYGTTFFAPSDTHSCFNGQGCGTLFQITTAGKLTALHDFCLTPLDGCPGGEYPFGLMQATNGTFYGMTVDGGSGNAGVIYTWSLGLGPFVKTVPVAGNAGTSVMILGNNLTGTTSVTFNGMAAAFTVVSDTEIRATVPTGAITGKVVVVTSGGDLTSNVAFQVLN